MISKQTISSREISELTGKPHADLMKAIRAMGPAWEKIGRGNFSLTSFIDQWNRQQPMYDLTKTECLYVATKFNDEARAKLVLRWEQLETQQRQTPSLPSDYLSALKALVISEEQRIKQLRELAPKAEYTDQVLRSQSDHTTTTIAKELGMSAQALHRILNEEGIIYKHDRHWVTYSRYDKMGFTKSRTISYQASQGQERTSVTTTWTEKGRRYIHELINPSLQIKILT